MEIRGKCESLKIFTDENDKWQGRILYHAIVERMVQEGVAGATVTRGLEGFGSSTRIHSVRWVDAAACLPIVVETVDRPEKIRVVLGWLPEMLPQHCLVTVCEVQVHHYYAPDAKHKLIP
jgi:PII-like signaling protein